MNPDAGVSFIVPVHNGARWLDASLAAILGQAAAGPIEVLAIDDGSTDGSFELVSRYAATGRVRLLAGEGRGAAAAINLGVRHAAYPIVCQIDQDVMLEPGWLSAILPMFADGDVAGVQGYYVTPADGDVFARVMGLDLEHRYSKIAGRFVDHICTGNSAYRVDALRAVGLFDESLGYGYDNDLSYRLGRAGYRLAFCRAARSVHRWREGPRGYVRQQYGVGYGRLDVVRKHPDRAGGDDVSGAGMIAHAALMVVTLGLIAAASILAIAHGPWRAPLVCAVALLVGLGSERFVVGLRVARRFRARAAVWFPLVHLGRDLGWAAAVTTWLLHRLVRSPTRPGRSMRRTRWGPA